MSKNGELKMLKYGRSIDAPINYHHRTGDSEGSGGNMLDLYAQEESAEDVYFGNADEHAREIFLKGFRVYLKKVFTEQERQFLKRLMSGNEKPHEVGRALGVNWFKYMQSVQRKAFKNVKPLLRLSKLSGWSGGAEFAALVLRRLSLLENGAALSGLAAYSSNKHVKACLYKKAYYEAHREKFKAWCKAYKKAHREEIRAKNKAYHEAYREEINARKKAYREAHLEKYKARDKAYRETHREAIKERRNASRRTPELLERIQE